MGKHIVRIVEDNTLMTGEGWAMARTTDGDLYFIVEESAVANEGVLMAAWEAAVQLEEDNAALRDAVMRAHSSPTT